MIKVILWPFSYLKLPEYLAYLRTQPWFSHQFSTASSPRIYGHEEMCGEKPWLKQMNMLDILGCE